MFKADDIKALLKCKEGSTKFCCYSQIFEVPNIHEHDGTFEQNHSYYVILCESETSICYCDLPVQMHRYFQVINLQPYTSFC